MAKSINAQGIPLLTENNPLVHSIYKQNNWDNSKNQSYINTVKKVDNISRFLINQAEVGEDWEQERKNNTHTKKLRVIDELDNKKHPTCGHPVVKPQDANIWMTNNKVVHSMAQQYDYNLGYTN